MKEIDIEISLFHNHVSPVKFYKKKNNIELFLFETAIGRRI